MKMPKSIIAFLIILFSFSYANAQTLKLNSPSNNATDQEKDITFDWDTIVDAYSFTLEISNSSSFPTFSTYTYYSSSTSYKLSFNPNSTFYWRVTASNGIPSPITSSTYKFTTGSEPTANFSLPRDIVCINSDIGVYSSSVGGKPLTLQWFADSANVDNGYSATPGISYRSSGKHQLGLTVSNSFGSDTKIVDIEVRDSIRAKIINSGSIKKCLSNFVTLTAQPSSLKYEWSTGATSQSISVNKAGKYSVKVIDSFCDETVYYDLGYDTLPLTINAGSSLSLCYDDSLELKPDASFIDYKWSTGQTTQSIFVKTPGTYDIIALDKDSCIYKATAVVDYPNKDIFKININRDSICKNKTISLSVPRINGYTNYIWSNGDTGIVSIINKTGAYFVTAENNGCKIYAEVQVSISALSCLSGIYTIGGNSPDFKTLQEAVTALNQRLVAGPVTFNIRNGNYLVNKTLIVDTFQRIGGNHKVTFQSESGNASKVIISNLSASIPAQTFFVKNSNIAFKNLTVKSSGIDNTFEIDSNISKIEITGSYLKDSVYSKANALILSRANDAYFANNTFIGSGYGIRINANDTLENVKVINNRFGAQSGTMVNAEKVKQLIITDNATIDFPLPSAQYGVTGVYLFLCNDFEIARNRLVQQPNTPLGQGIYLVICNLTDSTKPHIYNNIINVVGDGIYFNSCTNVNVYHNTIHGGIILSGAYDIGFTNNILDGTMEYRYYNYSFRDFRTNDLYPKYSNSIAEVNSLAGNSVSVNPMFDKNLIPTNTALNGAGTLISAIKTDAFGRTRDPKRADIGAVELINYHDLALDSIYLPTEKCGYSAAEDLKFSVKNFSTSQAEIINAGFMEFGYKLNNQAPVTLSPNFSASNSFSFMESEVLTYTGKLNLSAPGQYTLKVWVKLTYVNDSNKANDTLTIIINSKGKPTANFDFSNICAKQSTTFNNKTTFTGQEPQYTWVFHDGTKQTTKNATKVYATPGTYQVKLISVSQGGCKDSVIKNVIISGYPVATITRTGNTLTASSGGKTYQWLFNGSTINGATAQSYNATQDGKYAVIISNTAGCSDTSAEFNYIYTNIRENEQSANQVSIYPNPSDGKFSISLNFKPHAPLKVNVYDAVGRKVFFTSSMLQGNNAEINLLHLKPGIYLLNISGENLESNERIVIY